MMIRTDDIEYLNAINALIKKGQPIKRKIIDALGGKIDSRMMFCPECDEEIDQFDFIHLIMRDASDHPFIAIACEGFHPVDINA